MGAIAGVSGCGSSSTPTPTPTPAAVGSNSAPFCSQAGAVVTQVENLGAAFAGSAPGATPSVATIQQLLSSGASAIDSLESQAPSQITAGLHTLRTAYDQASARAQSATTAEQIASVVATFTTPAVSNAIQQVTTYLASACGMTPAPATASPVVSP